jgi:hypothetical protein
MNWIKVSDKKPNPNEVVLLYGKLTGIIPGCYDEHKNQWNTGGKFNLEINLCTPWIDLPSIPEE